MGLCVLMCVRFEASMLLNDPAKRCSPQTTHNNADDSCHSRTQPAAWGGSFMVATSNLALFCTSSVCHDRPCCSRSWSLTLMDLRWPASWVLCASQVCQISSDACFGHGHVVLQPKSLGQPARANTSTCCCDHGHGVLLVMVCLRERAAINHAHSSPTPGVPCAWDSWCTWSLERVCSFSSLTSIRIAIAPKKVQGIARLVCTSEVFPGVQLLFFDRGNRHRTSLTVLKDACIFLISFDAKICTSTNADRSNAGFRAFLSVPPLSQVPLPCSRR